MTTARIPRRHGRGRRWLVGGSILVVVVIFVALALLRGAGRAAAITPATVKVTKGNLVALVSGSGTVAAEQVLNLPFQATGTVTEVLVTKGDTVQVGQALARLDDRNLQVQIASARSALDSAKARLAQAQQGNAKPEDLAAAQAQVTSAQANLDKIGRGGSASDVASAQAAVRSAQAAYDAAVSAAGTTGSQLNSAAANVQKTEAALRQAQAAYDKVQDMPNLAMLPQALQLQQATIDYQTAKSNYESLSKTAGTDAQSKVDAAAAQLAQAKANLAKQSPTREDVAAAQANLDAAKANLGKLTAPATAMDLQIQQAAVTQAEGTLKQAELALENATLKAPFAGVVADVNIVPGSPASAATPAMKLINRNPLHVDLKLSENDVARIENGQPVKLTIQSLGGWQTDGQVSYVAPAADNTNGVVTYAVRVNFPDTDPKVKVGMTADLGIETARKDNVLLVPNAALLPKGTGHVVQVPDPGGKSSRPGQTATREVDVQTGLSDGTSTEILSGLSEGQEIVALPSSGAARQTSGMFGQ